VKFRCERDVLVEGFSAAARAVGSRAALPVLSGVRIVLNGDQMRLTGSDLDLTTGQLLCRLDWALTFFGPCRPGR
jgi:DNA polymerase III subunit beta